MSRSFLFYALTAVGFLCLVFPSMAAANPIPVIQYQATNLTDTIPGQDLWEYTYTVSYATPDTFLQNQGFVIAFDLNFYSNLEDPPPAVSDWWTFAFQPNTDPNFPLNGEYDALALVDNPSIANSFSLTFIWLGGAGSAPGFQPFMLYQFDTNGLVTDTLGSGQTIGMNNNVVPEPATGLLLASGLLAGAMLYRKRK